MATEGIIFGGHLLSKEEFTLVIEKWYSIKKKDFLKEIDEIYKDIELMIIRTTRFSESKGRVESSIKRAKGIYDAKKIYEKWEYISQSFFGNGTVSLIGIFKDVNGKNENFTFTNVIDEKLVMTKSGINVKEKGLKQLEASQKMVGNVFAAANIQDFLSGHFLDLKKTLSTYLLNNNEASLMHQFLATRKSNLNKANFHFTNSSYDQIVFNRQKNAEGKRLDAFMNHVGKYNSQLFNIMKTPRVDANKLENLQLKNHKDFYNIFQNTQEVQPWLVDSLNTASWLTGGDIVVVDKNGAVIYNIQLKSTEKGKTFELAIAALSDFAKNMKDILNEDNETTPKRLAELMYNELKTTSANDFKRGEDFIENGIYKMVLENLGIKD